MSNTYRYANNTAHPYLPLPAYDIGQSSAYAIYNGGRLIGFAWRMADVDRWSFAPLSAPARVDALRYLSQSSGVRKSRTLRDAMRRLDDHDYSSSRG